MTNPKTPEEAIDAFLEERPYNDLLQVAARLEDHGWAASMSQRDRKALVEAVRDLRRIADVLYLSRQYLLTPGEPENEQEEENDVSRHG